MEGFVTFVGFFALWGCLGICKVFIVSKSVFPSSNWLVQAKEEQKKPKKQVYSREGTTYGILFLAKSRCLFSSSCVTLWQNEWWEETAGQSSWNLYRRSEKGEKDALKRESMDVCLNQSLYPIKHWGSSPFGACPKAKRHTSFPFCECGGTMSWRMPCPGAVEENKEIVNTCSCLSIVSIYV